MEFIEKYLKINKKSFKRICDYYWEIFRIISLIIVFILLISWMGYSFYHDFDYNLWQKSLIEPVKNLKLLNFSITKLSIIITSFFLIILSVSFFSYLIYLSGINLSFFTNENSKFDMRKLKLKENKGLYLLGSFSILTIPIIFIYSPQVLYIQMLLIGLFFITGSPLVIIFISTLDKIIARFKLSYLLYKKNNSKKINSKIIALTSIMITLLITLIIYSDWQQIQNIMFQPLFYSQDELSGTTTLTAIILYFTISSPLFFLINLFPKAITDSIPLRKTQFKNIILPLVITLIAPLIINQLYSIVINHFSFMLIYLLIISLYFLIISIGTILIIFSKLTARIKLSYIRIKHRNCRLIKN